MYMFFRGISKMNSDMNVQLNVYGFIGPVIDMFQSLYDQSGSKITVSLNSKPMRPSYANVLLITGTVI